MDTQLIKLSDARKYLFVCSPPIDRVSGEAETVYRKVDSRERERKAAADAITRMRNRGWI